MEIALQIDGKIIVAGYVFGGSATRRDMLLVRFNPNGSLDTTFDGDGRATTDFGGNDIAYSVLIQRDGGIVSVGETCSTSSGNCSVALSRHKADGSLDITFNSTGKVTTSVNGTSDGAYAAVLQNNGKIVAAGYTFADGSFGFAVVRYNTDGTLDSSFGTNGKVTTNFGGSVSFADFDVIRSVAVQPNGNIVVAGRIFVGTTRDFAVARYLGDGLRKTRSTGLGRRSRGR